MNFFPVSCQKWSGLSKGEEKDKGWMCFSSLIRRTLKCSDRLNQIRDQSLISRLSRIFYSHETFELVWTHTLWHSAGKLENPVGKAQFFDTAQQLAPEERSEIHQRAALEQYLFIFFQALGARRTQHWHILSLKDYPWLHHCKTSLG